MRFWLWRHRRHGIPVKRMNPLYESLSSDRQWRAYWKCECGAIRTTNS